MALDFKFIGKMGAKARIFALLGGVVGLIGLIYVGVQLTSDTSATVGASSVTAAPKDLKSVPGGKLTPEYYRALQQANEQAAKQAQIQGSSAIPTLVNVGAPGSPTTTTKTVTGDCNVICSDEQVNVSNTLEDLVNKGDITPEVSASLQKLADGNISVDEYAQELDRLVKEGKITPEQARKLLDQYKKQHANKLLQESAKSMDGFIKMGDLPLEVANELLKAQKDNVSPEDYAAKLEELVRQGKISKETARQLLAQYKQQRAKGIVEKSIASLRKLGKDGLLTSEIEAKLIELENKMVPISEYKEALEKFVASGKLIPATAKKIMDEYLWQKSQIGSTDTINKMVDKAKEDAYADINTLLSNGRIRRDVATKLAEQIKNGVSMQECMATVKKFQTDGQIQAKDADELTQNCKTIGGLNEVAKKLPQLQGNNVSLAQYTDQLKVAVEAGALSPEQATELLKEYQGLLDSTSPSSLPRTATETAEATGAFAELQRRLQERQQARAEGQQAAEQVAASGQAAGGQATGQFSSIQQKAQRERNEAREQAITAEQNAMTGYAGQLINAWKPPQMARQGSVSYDEGKDDGSASGAAGAGAGGTGATSGAVATGKEAPLIKAGTVTFAVLDTQANSDYPDSPIMATIVDGPLKGAKLLGKLQTSEGPSGQQDRILLNFTLMNYDPWATTKSITAYAIDPDTARTVLASEVDYHYMKRFGAMFATSFIKGYASAIKNAGTSTTGIFGTSTSNPALSPSQKFAVALGQIGETVGKATEKYVDIPPTVKVNPGVGLGILFMADVTDQERATGTASGNAPGSASGTVASSSATTGNAASGNASKTATSGLLS